MTLGELADLYRPHLADESLGVRRSWEEVFTHTFRHYSRNTPLDAFDPDVLAEGLAASGMHPEMIAGYVKRWVQLLAQANDLQSSQNG